MEDEGLGSGFWLKLMGLIILGGFGVLLIFLLINAAVYRWSGIGALVFIFLVFGVIAYISDRRQVKRYEDDE